MNVIDVILPIFGLILAGLLFRRLSLFPDWLLKIVNDYVYYIGIPVICFLSLHDTSWQLLLDWRIYLINLLPMFIIAGFAYVVARAMKLENAVLPVFIICAFFGNTGYIGFPLNIAVQGKESLGLTAFISTMHTIVVFTLGVYLLKRYSGRSDNGIKLYRLPIIWAVIAGIVTSSIMIPDVIRLPLDIVVDSTSPLALVATGAMISMVGIREKAGAIGAISLIKLTLLPVIVIITAILSGATGTVYKTSLLEAATPVAVTNTVLAKQFGADHEFASAAVVVSTAVFALTLSILLLVL